MAKQFSAREVVHVDMIVNGNKAQAEYLKLSRTISDTKNELKAVQAEMKAMEAEGKSNTASYKDLNKQMKELNKTIDTTTKQQRTLLLEMKVEDKTISQLKQSIRSLKAIRDKSQPGSEAYKMYSKELETTRMRLKELEIGSQATGNSLARLSKNVYQYFGVIAAGAASVMAAFSGISKARDEYARFDDILADVMKTTNLTKNSVKELNDELQKIETRTSQEDLLGLARIAGKLGYTEIEDITEFVRANNQIIVALNEDLGGNVEETVNKIGKLVDIFKLKDIYSTEDAFLKVGSAINELGMASTANEGYMVEFARRMAGVAPLAGITIEEILGLGAALDQLGQTEEVSSTALSKLFLSMAKDASTYAKYAGMEIKAFQKLMEDDFMGAFTKVLQGVKDNSSGINELAATLGDLGQDGGRVIGVIGSLANNVDTLTGSIELSNKAMAEGNSITEEYNIKNETRAAELDKARKRVRELWIELGEKLWPVITTGNNLMATTIEILKTLITFFSNNARSIIALTSAVVAYYTAVQIAARWELITTTYMAAKRLILITLNGLYALLTGNLGRAAAAQRMLNVTMSLNPIGLVAAAVVGLTALLWKMSLAMSATEKAQKLANDTNQQAVKDTAAQRFEIEQLTKTIQDETKGRSIRLTAIKRMREIMPDVLKDYSDEAIMAGKATQAIENQTKAILYQAKIKAKQAALDRIVEENEKYNNPQDKGFWYKVGSVVVGEANMEHFSGRTRSQYEARLTAQNLALKDLQKTQEEYLSFKAENKTELENEDLGGGIGGGKTGDEEDKEAERLAKQEKQLQASIEKQIDMWKHLYAERGENEDKELLELEKRYAEFLKLTENNEEKRTEVASIYTELRLKRLREIDQANAKALLDQQKSEADIRYQQQLAEYDREYAAQVQAITQSNATAEEKELALTTLLKHAQEQRRQLEEQAAIERMVLLDAAISSGNLEIEEAKRVADEKKKIQEDLLQKQIEYALEEQRRRLEIENKTNEALFDIKQETVKAYEAAFGLMGDFFEENSGMAKMFLVLEKAAAAAHVIVSLQREIAGYYATNAILGPAGVALATKLAAAAKIRAGISLATIAATTIKGLAASPEKGNAEVGNKSPRHLRGREQGGYLDVTREQDGKLFRAKNSPSMRGYVSNPTVIVGESGKEWVANNDMVTNPFTAPIIAWLDTVQRQGQINPAMLSQISRSAVTGTRVSGRQSGGRISDDTTNTFTPMDPGLINVLNRFNDTVSKLENRLSNIRAEVSLLGKNGFVEKMDELNKIQNQSTL